VFADQQMVHLLQRQRNEVRYSFALLLDIIYHSNDSFPFCDPSFLDLCLEALNEYIAYVIFFYG